MAWNWIFIVTLGATEWFITAVGSFMSLQIAWCWGLGAPGWFITVVGSFLCTFKIIRNLQKFIAWFVFQAQNSSLIIIQGLLRLKIHLNCMTSASHILRTSVISQKQKFQKHEKRCQVKTQEKLKGKALKGGTLRVPDGLAYSQLH